MAAAAGEERRGVLAFVCRFAHVTLALAATAVFGLGVLGPAVASPEHFGGVLDVGLSTGEPDSLDPTLLRNLSAVEIANTYCERLYVFNGRAQVVPQLAAALPAISKDKLTYTIPLRKGVQFNDGTPFNAPAVVASIERYITDPASSRQSDYADVASVTAVGDIMNM